MGSILIVDDNVDILIAAKLLLKKHYQTVLTTDNPFEIDKILGEQKVNVVLLDMNFSIDSVSGKEGFYWLNKILQRDPAIVVLLMTAYGDIQLAVDAIKAGASDFITKPWQNEQLIAAMAAAFGHSKDKQRVHALTRRTQGLSHIINDEANHNHAFLGESKVMQTVFETIEKAAKTDANILITGESGTGKELTAHAVHNASLRVNAPMISLDMGAVSDSLFESELFGHKKGAFTDAKNDRIGRFELANNGTLFLDELGNLPLNLQVKLLAAIQNRQITPVGSNRPIDVDIRLICATNDNLHQASLDGRFRQDLLYRVNTVEIRLPPLRERMEDIPLLAKHYLTQFSSKYKRSLYLEERELEMLMTYTWPGNIRELSHAIERAVILSEGEKLEIAKVIDASTQLQEVTQHTLINPQNRILEEDTFNLEVLEQRTIKAALKHYKGNVSHAAKAVGLTRGAMYRRLEKYGL